MPSEAPFGKSVPVTVRIPLKLVNMIDELVNRGIYPSRSEFIRDAIRRLLSLYYSEHGRSSSSSSKARGGGRE